jgi:hypothetical protein
VLEDVKEGGLTGDSIIMIILLEEEIKCLEKQIDLAEATIRLIKEKKVFATYDGNREKYDIDQFTITKIENGKDDKYSINKK